MKTRQIKRIEIWRQTAIHSIKTVNVIDSAIVTVLFLFSLYNNTTISPCFQFPFSSLFLLIYDIIPIPILLLLILLLLIPLISTLLPILLVSILLISVLLLLIPLHSTLLIIIFIIIFLSIDPIHHITLNCSRWEWGERVTWRGQRTVWNSCQTPWKSVSRQVRWRNLDFDSVSRILSFLFFHSFISSLWSFYSLIHFFQFSYFYLYHISQFPCLLILVLTLSSLLQSIFISMYRHRS